ncbi:unnamed protein product [Amoebophrya sp. A120]|nr:unnamed protein product [Amoebophrya sp. A120]|eukprot:GSA120T00021863001.1
MRASDVADSCRATRCGKRRNRYFAANHAERFPAMETGIAAALGRLSDTSPVASFRDGTLFSEPGQVDSAKEFAGFVWDTLVRQNGRFRRLLLDLGPRHTQAPQTGNEESVLADFEELTADKLDSNSMLLGVELEKRLVGRPGERLPLPFDFFSAKGTDRFVADRLVSYPPTWNILKLTMSSVQTVPWLRSSVPRLPRVSLKFLLLHNSEDRSLCVLSTEITVLHRFPEQGNYTSWRHYTGRLNLAAKVDVTDSYAGEVFQRGRIEFEDKSFSFLSSPDISFTPPSFTPPSFTPPIRDISFTPPTRPSVLDPRRRYDY